MSQLELNLSALNHNIQKARKWGPPGARLRAMVKADAYGHGLEKMSSFLSDHVDEFGVAQIDEAEILQSYLIDQLKDKKKCFPRIFIMSGDKDWESPFFLKRILKGSFVPVLSSIYEIEYLVKTIKVPLMVEIKVDTGIDRLGITPTELGKAIKMIHQNKNLNLSGVLTHYASSDELDQSFSKKQDQIFFDSLHRTSSELLHDVPLHTCNSGALISRSLGHELGRGTQIIRPGLMLYGAAPSFYQNNILQKGDLCEISRWITRVIETKTISKGSTVGYGRTWTANCESRVAVLPVGYDDGYSRALSNRAHVLIHGKRFPVIGLISMNLTTVLVDHNVSVGDEVVLLGAQKGYLGEEEIGVWEIANICNTIPNEVWTGLGLRIERVLL